MFDFNINLTKLKQEVSQKRGLSPRQHETTKPEIKLSDFASACDSLSRLITAIDQRTNNVVKSESRDNPSATFENCTFDAQRPLPEEGDQTMAKLRMRICVGTNDDGSPVTMQISGKTQLDLADNVARALLNSSRRGLTYILNLTKMVVLVLIKSAIYMLQSQERLKKMA